MTNSAFSYKIWQACPTEIGWLPWESVAAQWAYTSTEPLLAERAHSFARELRASFPGHLFAVRPAVAGEPLWPTAMADELCHQVLAGMANE
jgi:hypothetical protein